MSISFSLSLSLSFSLSRALSTFLFHSCSLYLIVPPSVPFSFTPSLSLPLCLLVFLKAVYDEPVDLVEELVAGLLPVGHLDIQLQVLHTVQ